MPGMMPGFIQGITNNPFVQPGMNTVKQVQDIVGDARGYMTGYDTQQTPFQVARERGLAGVLGGTIDNITMGATDFDKRGDSKKQKDTKEFLRKFVYGTDGMRQENSNTTPGFTERMGLFGTPEGRQAKYDESKKNLLGMPLPEFGVSEKLGLPNFGS